MLPLAREGDVARWTGDPRGAMNRSPQSGPLRLYRGLHDLRRLGFEAERLWARLCHHAAWEAQPPGRRQELRDLLDAPLREPRRDAEHVERDVRRLTQRVATLARAWHALETQGRLP